MVSLRGAMLRRNDGIKWPPVGAFQACGKPYTLASVNALAFACRASLDLMLA